MKEMKKLIILPFFIIIGCSNIPEKEYVLPDYQPKYAKMADDTIAELIKFKPNDDTPLADLNYGIKDYDKEPIYSLYCDPGKALIKLKNGDWIYIIIVSSWHDDEDGDAPEITLAIDNKGNLWRNGGHVCGGIGFKSENKKAPISAEDFFNRFPWRIGKKKINWKKINK